MGESNRSNLATRPQNAEQLHEDVALRTAPRRAALHRSVIQRRDGESLIKLSRSPPLL